MKARWLTTVMAANVIVGVASAQSPPAGFVPAAPAPSADTGRQIQAIFGDSLPPSRAGSDFGPPAASCPGTGCADANSVPFTPFMLGDFIGPVANLFTQFKIGEGESPRPVDRAFFKYNYYNNVNPTRWTNPTEPIHNVSLNLYTLGMEKTFFDRTVSVGIRVPFDTISADPKEFRVATDPATGAAAVVPGGPGLHDAEYGNMIAIVKAVIMQDRESGSLLSGGAVVSIPTASSVTLDPGLSALLYLQPFSGFIWNAGDLFVQGFSSITLPIVRPESIVSFNDLGVGYWVYRDATGSRTLSGVAPTVEIHYTAPIRQPDANATLFGTFKDGIRVHNTVDFTFGATWLFANRATLGTGVAVPVTGDRPFDAEILVQLNLLF
jgi:hypothetical protein